MCPSSPGFKYEINETADFDRFIRKRRRSMTTVLELTSHTDDGVWRSVLNGFQDFNSRSRGKVMDHIYKAVADQVRFILRGRYATDTKESPSLASSMGSLSVSIPKVEPVEDSLDLHQLEAALDKITPPEVDYNLESFKPWKTDSKT